MTEPDTELLDQIDFDPNDEVSYYYGNLTREDVKEILNDAQIGTFLVRDSTKDVDQKVLCVKEAHNCINNYKIIHSVTISAEKGGSEHNHVFYIFGKEDCLFPSIAKILEFYSTHYLNQSPLVRPAFHHKKVKALYDFQENGDPNEDLYFKEGEILTILEYTQGEHWWKAINQSGAVGLIPATLVRRVKPNESYLNSKLETQKAKSDDPTDKGKKENGDLDKASGKTSDGDEDSIEEGKLCPFDALVIEDYTPSPYEHSHIALRKGQTVTVLEMKSIGKWYGQLKSDGKKGLFPFNRVQVVN